MSWQQGPPGGGEPPAPPPPNYPPPGYYNYGVPPQPGYNGLAIASLVLSVSFWLTAFVGSILGIIFGLVAKRQIRERGERGGAMATAGIVVGIVGLALTVLFFVLIIVFAEDVENDDEIFRDRVRRPAAVRVSSDAAAAPPRVAVVPARA